MKQLYAVTVVVEVVKAIKILFIDDKNDFFMSDGDVNLYLNLSKNRARKLANRKLYIYYF